MNIKRNGSLIGQAANIEVFGLHMSFSLNVSTMPDIAANFTVEDKKKGETPIIVACAYSEGDDSTQVFAIVCQG